MYNMIVSLVGRDPAVMNAAWEHLNAQIVRVPALPIPEIIPPAPKRLKEAG
jgi:hypothetical protein